jgi:hypothetical protein
VLSGIGLCDELITRPEESYRLWCVVVCDLETLWIRSPWPTGGCLAKKSGGGGINRFEDLIFINIWTVILWDTPPWIVAGVHQRFGQIFDFDIQGRSIKEGSKFLRNYFKHRYHEVMAQHKPKSSFL